MQCYLSRFLMIVVFSLIANGLWAQGTVALTIDRMRNDKGVCRACIFGSAEAFNGESGKPLQCVAVPVKGGRAEARFAALPPGSYAVFVFHDENLNNRMDKNFVGIPKEGYGASRNNLPFAAAPTFTGNKFQLNNNGIRLHIRVRNL